MSAQKTLTTTSTPRVRKTPSTRNIGDGIVVIKLNDHKVPQFKEVMGKDWIYYGQNNDYPDYLLQLYNRSAKHNAIINQKSFYIFGGGDADSGDTIVNDEGETLNDIIKKSIIDFELFNGFYVEVIWSRAGTKAQLRHVNFSHIRSNEDNTVFYYTKKWNKEYFDEDKNPYRLANGQPQIEKDFEQYEPYNPSKKRGKQLFFYKAYRPDLDTYTLPDYIGAIPYIETDFEIANYWYNAVKNGFTASHIVTFYGDAGTPEEQEKLEKRIKKKFTGTDKAGRIILNFSQNKEKGGSEIANIIPQDLDKQFNILNQTVQEEIFSGHRITSPMLLGIKTPGQLGGRTELIEANELFQNTYVSPKQDVFNKSFSKLAREIGIKKEIQLQKLIPIGMDLTNNERAWNILTAEEQREAIGREPIKKDKKSEEAERIIANVQALSPLVVNEVMNNLTRNEIRSLIGLAPMKDGDKIIVPTVPGQDEPKKDKEEFMSKNFINVFRKFGSQKKGKLIDSRPLTFEDTQNLRRSEEKFARLRDTQLSVLDLLNKDPLMPPQEIAKVLEVSEKRVNSIISSLKEKELIEESKQKSGDENIPVLTPVREAKKILEDTPAPTESIFTVYSYEWREGFSDEDADTSRDFCLELMAESEQRKAEGRLWTREDIEAISAEAGYNVFEMRGGWYTKPGTDVHLPYCRHLWVQNLYSTENG